MVVAEESYAYFDGRVNSHESNGTRVTSMSMLKQNQVLGAIVLN